MRVLFGLLLGGSVALSLAFVVLLGDPRRRMDRAMAWFLASTGWAALVVDLALFLAVLGARIPPWVFAAGLGLQDVAFGWRLWLIIRERRPRKE